MHAQVNATQHRHRCIGNLKASNQLSEYISLIARLVYQKNPKPPFFFLNTMKYELFKN